MTDILYGVALMVLLVALMALGEGCGAVQEPQVQAELARAAACEAAEQATEDALAAEAITRDKALARIDAIRTVCDDIHERITEGE